MGEVQRFTKHSEDITNMAASQATFPRISTNFIHILYNVTLNLPLGLYGRRTPCSR